MFHLLDAFADRSTQILASGPTRNAVSLRRTNRWSLKQVSRNQLVSSAPGVKLDVLAQTGDLLSSVS